MAVPVGKTAAAVRTYSQTFCGRPTVSSTPTKKGAGDRRSETKPRPGRRWLSIETTGPDTPRESGLAARGKRTFGRLFALGLDKCQALRRFRPDFVAVFGVGAYRTAFGVRRRSGACSRRLWGPS